MSCDGVLDLCTVTGGVDAEKFSDFVKECLLPQLQPFTGTNARSVVILDNAAIHHVDGIVELIRSRGALVQFLSPYSPDFDANRRIIFQSQIRSKIKLRQT